MMFAESPLNARNKQVQGLFRILFMLMTLILIVPVVVILGTAHSGAGSRFVLCDKGYRTPRGDLPVDREFLARLEKAQGRDLRSEMLVHRSEHSIEFQALFLAHLYAGQPLPGIVPILCTTVEDCLASGRAPEELPEIATKLKADVVVMGAVARNRWKRLFIGATAERTLEHLPCDLLIVKPDWFRTPVDMQAHEAA